MVTILVIGKLQLFFKFNNKKALMEKLKFKKMWPWKLMITQKVIFSIFLLIKGVFKT